MAGEIQVGFVTGRTVYALIRNRIAQIWNTSTSLFESYTTANLANYVISLTEQGVASGYYVGAFPAAIVPGTYSVEAREQKGGSAAENDPRPGEGNIDWNGSALLPLADLATSGQLGQIAPIRQARGVMLQNFLFDLVSSADHVTAFVSGVVSGQIVRDAGSFGVLQSGNFVEVGLGFYRVSLTSGDLLANTAALYISANGISGGTADPRKFSFVLQRTSGQ